MTAVLIAPVHLLQSVNEKTRTYQLSVANSNSANENATALRLQTNLLFFAQQNSNVGRRFTSR